MDIKEKIAKLREKTPENGATEAESIAAFALADMLRIKHHISEEELNNLKFKKDMKKETVDTAKKSQDPCAKLCGVAIAKFCEVKVWSSNVEDFTVLNFFGLNEDVEMAEFLYDMVCKSMSRSWQDYLKTGDKPKTSMHKLYWSFREGFANNITMRLYQMIEARKPKGELTGTDLVVMKNQLVEEGMAKLLPGVKLRPSNGKATTVNIEAFKQGAEKGKAVNLNRPIKGKGSRKLIS